MPFLENILQVPIIKRHKGVLFLSEPLAGFEEQYIALRKKEKWFYDKQQLKNLPTVSETDAHYKEWIIRRASAFFFLEYLSSKKEAVQTILDIGCGNGWLTNMIAQHNNGISVVGMDMNSTELELAANVYSQKNCIWIYADILQNIYHKATFDIILLSASVQYFPDLKQLLIILLPLLTATGEIHIFDTPFYTENSIVAARNRTEAYYTLIGFPDMVQYYRHPLFNDLEQFNYRIIYKSSFFIKMVFRITGKTPRPFPHIVISQ